MRRLLTSIHRRLLPPNPWIGWMPYLWLIYLGFFYGKYFFMTPPGREIVAVIITSALFLRLYFSGYWRHGRQLWLNIGGLAALGAIMAPINAGSSVFLIYAGSFTPFVGSRRVTIAMVAGLLLVVGLEAFFVQPNPGFWAPAAILIPLIALANYHYYSMARKESALRKSREEVRQLATVAERERIARDLHDLLGHTLSVIALKSELAAKLVERDATRAGNEIRDVERISREALVEVREAVTGYRRQGLGGELDSAVLALKAADIAYRTEGKAPELSAPAESVLAMVLREAVTNVIRHAGAGRCRIALDSRNGVTRLVVEDDGRGARTYGGGSGLDGMRARVEDLGGEFRIEADGGTRLTVTLPPDTAPAPERATPGSAA